MDIIMSDKDKIFIDNVNEDLKENKNECILIANEIGKDYSLNFKVLDIAKANAFLYSIVLQQDTEKLKEIRDTIGIEFTSISYGYREKERIKSILKDAIREIDRI